MNGKSTSLADKVNALDAGVGDYLTKPFGVGELLARMRVALRHRALLAGEAGQVSTQFCVGDLKLDLAARRVFVAEKEMHLTPLEYRLLTTLAHHATHRMLLKEAWGPPYLDQTHYLCIHMANLRRKIESNPAQPRYLLTEQGVGYRLAEE